jgi:protein-disulfide isomerase
MLKSLARTALLALPLLAMACGQAKSGNETAAAGSAKAAPKSAGSVFDAKDIVIGDRAAPLTIVEYASVTCPHCADFHREVFPAIKAKYIDTGKVNLVFREFPTYPEFKSYLGSMVARCAGEKGGADAYFLVLGALFETQRVWAYGDTELELKKIAAQAGMDEPAFAACLKRQDILDAMNAKIDEAQKKLNVTGTPSFFINGEKVTGALDADTFSKRIDEALAKAAG